MKEAVKGTGRERELQGVERRMEGRKIKEENNGRGGGERCWGARLLCGLLVSVMGRALSGMEGVERQGSERKGRFCGQVSQEFGVGSEARDLVSQLLSEGGEGWKEVWERVLGEVLEEDMGVVERWIGEVGKGGEGLQAWVDGERRKRKDLREELAREKKRVEKEILETVRSILETKYPLFPNLEEYLQELRVWEPLWKVEKKREQEGENSGEEEEDLVEEGYESEDWSEGWGESELSEWSSEEERVIVSDDDEKDTEVGTEKEDGGIVLEGFFSQRRTGGEEEGEEEEEEEEGGRKVGRGEEDGRNLKGDFEDQESSNEEKKEGRSGEDEGETDAEIEGEERDANVEGEMEGSEAKADEEDAFLNEMALQFGNVGWLKQEEDQEVEEGLGLFFEIATVERPSWSGVRRLLAEVKMTTMANERWKRLVGMLDKEEREFKEEKEKEKGKEKEEGEEGVEVVMSRLSAVLSILGGHINVTRGGVNLYFQAKSEAKKKPHSKANVGTVISQNTHLSDFVTIETQERGEKKVKTIDSSTHNWSSYSSPVTPSLSFFPRLVPFFVKLLEVWFPTLVSFQMSRPLLHFLFLQLRAAKSLVAHLRHDPMIHTDQIYVQLVRVIAKHASRLIGEKDVNLWQTVPFVEEDLVAVFLTLESEFFLGVC